MNSVVCGLPVQLEVIQFESIFSDIALSSSVYAEAGEFSGGQRGTGADRGGFLTSPRLNRYTR